jgi:hypothetical protein
MLSDEAMLKRMAKGWRGGKPETICGNGSTLRSTDNIRRWLPSVVKRYGIMTLNDAGAGDMNWIRQIKWDVEYRPFDLVPRAETVTKLDITNEAMPLADGLLCRHVLNHLDAPRIEAALALFRKSSRYLIATQFDWYDGNKEFTRLDLRAYLWDYIESVNDGGADGCKLAIWSI